MPLNDKQWYEDAPRWSPDGEWIAYTRTLGSAGGWSLVKIRFGAGRSVRVVVDASYGVSNRLAVDVSLPYIASEYSGPKQAAANRGLVDNGWALLDQKHQQVERFGRDMDVLTGPR